MNGFIFKIIKAEDGQYRVTRRDETLKRTIPISDFEEMYNIALRVHSHGNEDVLFVALLASGFAMESWYDKASMVIYECEASGKQWEYDRDTYKWKRVTDDR